MRAYKGEPFLVEDVRCRQSSFPTLPGGGHRPRASCSLAQEFGILLGKGEERLCVGTAAADVAEHLSSLPGAPVLVLDS